MSARGKKVASPPETPEIAASLARFGWPVFPVTIYRDASGKRHKVPAVKWKAEATTDVSTVNRWWAGEFSGCWIGVYAEKAGIVTIDLDVRGDVNGFDSLRRADLELPNSLNYGSIGGGTHVVCAAPEGIELTIGAAILGPDGKPLPGVDIRSGAGLMVYYGPAFTDPPKLAPAPDWALVRREKTHRGGGDTDRAPDADVSAYLARCVPGKPEKAVKAACVDVVFPAGDSHDVMLETVAALVRLGSRGAKGVPAALEKTRKRYVAGGADRARDWDNALAGSVKRLGLPPVTLELDEDERKVIAQRNTPEAIHEAKAERRAARTSPVAPPLPGERVLEDGPLAEELAPALAATWAYARALGLMHYARGVWSPAEEVLLVESVREALVAIESDEHTAAAMRGDMKRMDRARTLLSRNRAKNVAEFVRGILAKSEPTFDAHPDLLNVKNGVVDLRTGELRPHDPALFLTKIAGHKYVPGATHPDWHAALEALPADVRPYMQVHAGQAATGYPPDDDKMLVLEGSGENAKSTFVNGVKRALGTHARVAPEKLFMGNPGDHPTELMTLMGARLVIAEETPEGRRLNVKRVKDAVGTAEITARPLYRDNVTFAASHAVWLSTNYTLQINETDHGTWRRFARVVFPFRFVAEPSAENERAADRGLRGRLLAGRGGRGEAVLAWIVEGARLWYDAGKVLPEPPDRVAADTDDWRASADLVFAFAAERLTFAPDATTTTRELADAFSTWLFSNGHSAWSHQTITARLEAHDVMTRNRAALRRTRIDGKQVRAWTGVEVRPNDAVLSSFVTPHK
ncbi:MAG TPA: phage/plasmid primase, P4 family [Microbacteriaceae bacterium]|nr:phage/plasmid primase, P4 family [Microbacteriaceae bacterium]